MTNTNFTTLLRKNFFFTNFDADSFEDAIYKLTSMLVSSEIVREGFAEQVIEREKLYPTALPTNIIKVAIPHPIDSTNVIVPTITVAKLTNRVRAIEMGTLDKEIEVDLIVLLSVKGDSSQIEILTKLISLFSDEKFMQEVKYSDNRDILYQLFFENML